MDVPEMQILTESMFGLWALAFMLSVMGGYLLDARIARLVQRLRVMG